MIPFQCLKTSSPSVYYINHLPVVVASTWEKVAVIKKQNTIKTTAIILKLLSIRTQKVVRPVSLRCNLLSLIYILFMPGMTLTGERSIVGALMARSCYDLRHKKHLQRPLLYAYCHRNDEISRSELHHFTMKNSFFLNWAGAKRWCQMQYFKASKQSNCYSFYNAAKFNHECKLACGHLDLHPIECQLRPHSTLVVQCSDLYIYHHDTRLLTH